MLDVFIFEKFNAFAGNWKILDWIGIFFADYFQYFLGAILVVLLFWPKKDVLKNRLMVISAGISVFLSRIVITEIIKIIIHRSRPYIVLETAKKLISENANFQSFPSGHAAIFFALAMAIWFYNKKLGIWFFIGAILMGIARIFVGVHWPSDVLGGAVIGIISAIIIDKVIRSKIRHNSQQPNQIFSDTKSPNSNFS